MAVRYGLFPTPNTVSPPVDAVTNLLLAQQGGPSNNLTNSQKLTWNAVPGAGSYNIYRNGLFLANTALLTYTDTTATASNDPTWATACTTWTYTVRALGPGGEGPAATPNVYFYQNGSAKQHAADFSFGTPPTVINWLSSLNGRPCVRIDYQGGGFQPISETPLSPAWDLEMGAFNYFTIDINPGPTVVDSQLFFGTVSRLPSPPTGGDVFGWHPQVNLFNYGPAPIANIWATYKVPMVDVGNGVCNIQASVSGTTLTVSSILSGSPLVDAGGFIYGDGAIPNGTFLMSYNQASAIGTFGLNNSATISSRPMLFRRTNMYKIGISRSGIGAPATFYLDNFGFTTV